VGTALRDLKAVQKEGGFSTESKRETSVLFFK